MSGGARNKDGARPARGLSRALAVLAAVAAIVVAGPGIQEAEAAAPCPGRLVKAVSFPTGDLRVYRHGKHACAVTLARRPGAKRPMSVSLQARGARAVGDSGRFGRQAGPVTVYAQGRCVRATGSVAGTSRSTGWILC